MIHFILGGARSGKSRFAERQVLALAAQLTSNSNTGTENSTNNNTNLCEYTRNAVYIATGTAIDTEMDHRILKHQNDRGDNWQLIECPLFLADTLSDLDNHNIYLVDCLTLWLNNQLYAVDEASSVQQRQHLDTEIDKLIVSLSSVKADVFIVSNEIGLGVIPMGASTRLYVDYCGWLNQKIAEISDKVTLVTAGIPLCIKSINAE